MPINQSPPYIWLAHPLLLLIVGAIISSFLVPLITRRWQDHKKELELKTGLVAEISETVMRMIMAIQFAELGTSSQTKEDFDNAFMDWSVASSVIGSKLWAFFPNSNIPPDWDLYVDLVTKFYALGGIKEPSRRKELLAEMKEKYFKDIEMKIDWEVLTVRSRSNYITNWDQLKKSILNRKGQLLQKILDAQLKAF